MNSTFQDIFEDEFALSATTVTLSLIEFCSSFLLLLIIHFERYGGDPQKRSLVNQLTSYICAATFIVLVTKNLLIPIRVIFGCIHPWFGYSANICVEVLVFCIMMFCIEILLYQLLEVFAYRLVVDLNEDNCGYFFSIINLVVSASLKVLDYIKMGNQALHLYPDLEKMWICEENVTAKDR